MRKAVILFNLGGPDSLEAVEPFLFNLFNDQAIISLPTILRYPLAKFISAPTPPSAHIRFRSRIPACDSRKKFLATCLNTPRC